MAGVGTDFVVAFVCIYSIWPSNQTYTVASAPTVTGSVFMQRFTLFFGTVNLGNKCGFCFLKNVTIYPVSKCIVN